MTMWRDSKEVKTLMMERGANNTPVSLTWYKTPRPCKDGAPEGGANFVLTYFDWEFKEIGFSESHKSVMAFRRAVSLLKNEKAENQPPSQEIKTMTTTEIPLPAGMEYWAAHTASECLPYQDFLPADYGAEAIATTEGLEKPWHVLSRKLWDIQNAAENPTPLGGDGSDGTCETPDGQYDLNNGDKARQWWPRLTPVEQTALVKAWEKEYVARFEGGHPADFDS